jgi:hypothetical protein
MAQRCIHIEAPTLGKYIPEADLDASFAEDAGAIFAALLDGVALALRDVTHVTLDRAPRMADFARWAAAGLPALGFTATEFLSAYHANQIEAVEVGLESSAIGQSVRTFMNNRKEWTGTSSELLKILSQIAGDIHKGRAWPQSPKGLINALRRLGPSLRQRGIQWKQVHERDRRSITLCTIGSQASQVSQSGESVTDVTHVTHSPPLCTHGGEPWAGDL